jgi:hypothetical protein
MFFVSALEAKSIERTRKVCRTVDENCRVLDLLLLAEFTQKQHGELRRTRLKQPCVQDFVRRGIDGCVQPVTFIVDLNHGLVDRNVIRLGIAAGLYVGFLHPVVNRRPTAFDTQPLDYLFGIRK